MDGVADNSRTDAYNKTMSIEKAPNLKINISNAAISSFCRKWSITELAFFGSVLRDDFGPDSDIDVLVVFAPEAKHSLFDKVRMEDELEQIFKRTVDLVSRRAIESSENYLRRRAILDTAKAVYVA